MGVYLIQQGQQHSQQPRMHVLGVLLDVLQQQDPHVGVGRACVDLQPATNQKPTQAYMALMGRPNKTVWTAGAMSHTWQGALDLLG